MIDTPVDHALRPLQRTSVSLPYSGKAGENFWSLLKRRIKGTYISVEPLHLFRYLDEQVFRFNKRKQTDGSRFIDALSGATGRRVTYKELTGKEIPPRILQ